MNKVTPCVIAALAALAATGCTKGAQASADTASIESSIKTQEAQWEKDYNAKDINALAGHYADDGVLGAPGDKLASNEVDRRKALQPLVDDPNLKISFASDRIEVAQSGDLAYSRGHYSMTVTDKATNKPATGTGSYLTVYKKEADGSWKAVEDFITPGPAPAAETAAK
jgi:ketosteroid isomerase-like protein